MQKYRFVFNPYDVEKWVNDMAAQGWHLKKFTWLRFSFERGEPGSHIYRHDELEWGTAHEDEYLEFLESSGIECVDRSGNVMFFRKRASEGPFELYTDKKTKVNNLSKKITLLACLLLLNLVIGLTGLLRGLPELATEYVTFMMSICNLLIVVLFALPLIRIIMLQKHLKKELDVYTD
ncbi:DUF2812 domain-containing protein [Lysinibacillus sp. NPDC096418]|uniref:DUF2812 domain-containing protein n=1 Tax=Lysinibacillus sp. NPDC096418 TaxID=3364138 RepID=UPI0038244F93